MKFQPISALVLLVQAFSTYASVSRELLDKRCERPNKTLFPSRLNPTVHGNCPFFESMNTIHFITGENDLDVSRAMCTMARYKTAISKMTCPCKGETMLSFDGADVEVCALDEVGNDMGPHEEFCKAVLDDGVVSASCIEGCAIYVRHCCCEEHALDHVLSFDGSSDYVEVPAASPGIFSGIADGDFTILGHFRGAAEDQQVSHPILLSNRHGGQGFLFGFHSRWGGSANKIPYMQIDGTNWIAYNDPPAALDGEWHTFVATKKGDTLTYFMDGIKLVDFTQASRIGDQSISTNGGDTWIGRDPRSSSNTAFEGEIAYVGVWSEAVEEGDLGSLVSEYSGPKEDGLVAFWEMLSTDDSDTQVFDTTEQYDGAIKGAEWIEME